MVEESKKGVVENTAPIVKVSYIAVTPIKDNGTRYEIGDLYKGKSIKQLLECEAIKVNK